MVKHFVSPLYQERFMLMAAEDGMDPQDSERASLFCLNAGNEGLYRKKRFIYNPVGHCIRACLDNPDVDFSSGAKSLVRLGFNLYNGWLDRYTTPLSLLSSLDSSNLQLAGNAIMIQLNSQFLEELVLEKQSAAETNHLERRCL